MVGDAGLLVAGDVGVIEGEDGGEVGEVAESIGSVLSFVGEDGSCSTGCDNASFGVFC